MQSRQFDFRRKGEPESREYQNIDNDIKQLLIREKQKYQYTRQRIRKLEEENR